MKKPAPTPALRADPPLKGEGASRPNPLPAEGGSFIRLKDGSLERAPEPVKKGV